VSVRELLRDDARAAGVQTLVDLVEYRAAIQPSDVVFRFINSDGREEEALTFATLQRRARAIVEATTHFRDPERIASASTGLGQPMVSLETSKLEAEQLLAPRGR